nr:immunoglobulin heavy chain junction region [Mus musculus]NSM07621.1 immunoglobulin heavy chain junction region [Mus musculus]
CARNDYDAMDYW